MLFASLEQQKTQGSRLLPGRDRGACAGALAERQIAPEFVIAEHDGMEAVAHIAFGLRTDHVERRGVRAAVFANKAGVEAARGRSEARLAIVEQREDRTAWFCL